MDKQEVSPKPDILLPNPVKADQLDLFGEEFFITEIQEGDDVHIGGGLAQGDFWLRCDWSEFAQELTKITPERLEELYQDSGDWKDELTGVDEETKRLIFATYKTAQTIQRLLGNPATETKRSDSFNAFSNGVKKAACIKPLSRCRGEAMCTEYSLLAQHVLSSRLQVPTAVVVGQMDIPGFAPGNHTFNVVKEGNLVYDPTMTMAQPTLWPPRLFQMERPLTARTLSNKTQSDLNIIKGTDILTKQTVFYGS